MFTFKAKRQALNGEKLFFVVEADTKTEALIKVLSSVPSIRSNGWYSELFINTLEDTLQDMKAQGEFCYFNKLILIEITELIFASGLAAVSI